MDKYDYSMCKITNTKFHDSLSPVDVNWVTKFKQESIMDSWFNILVP